MTDDKTKYGGDSPDKGADPEQDDLSPEETQPEPNSREKMLQELGVDIELVDKVKFYLKPFLPKDIFRDQDISLEQQGSVEEAIKAEQERFLSIVVEQYILDEAYDRRLVPEDINNFVDQTYRELMLSNRPEARNNRILPIIKDITGYDGTSVGVLTDPECCTRYAGVYNTYLAAYRSLIGLNYKDGEKIFGRVEIGALNNHMGRTQYQSDGSGNNILVPVDKSRTKTFEENRVAFLTEPFIPEGADEEKKKELKQIYDQVYTEAEEMRMRVEAARATSKAEKEAQISIDEARDTIGAADNEPVKTDDTAPGKREDTTDSDGISEERKTSWLGRLFGRK